jgi:hypothetical protein
MIFDQWHPQNAHLPTSVAYQSPTVAKLPPPTDSACPTAIDSHPKATQPFHQNGHLEDAMLKGLIPPAPIISHPEMEGYVARFQNLHGSEEALVDSERPGARRCKISLVGRPNAGSLAWGHRGLTSAEAHGLSRNPEGEVQGLGP